LDAILKLESVSARKVGRVRDVPLCVPQEGGGTNVVNLVLVDLHHAANKLANVNVPEAPLDPTAKFPVLEVISGPGVERFVLHVQDP